MAKSAAAKSAATAAKSSGIRTRNEMDPRYCWNLELMYATPADWEKDFARIDALLAPVMAFQGKIKGPASVAKLFEAQDALSLLIDRLRTYAHHREDEDTGNAANQARKQRILAKMVEASAQLAWIEPELLARPRKTLETWSASPALAPWRRTMTLLLRMKPHILSRKEETLLSLAAEILHAPVSTYGYLANADLKFPDVKDDKGVRQPLSNGRYVTFLENRDRAVRRRAFEALYDVFIAHRNTMAATLSTAVKRDNFLARARHFPSALDAALHPDNVPPALYNALIEGVHGALPVFHEYLDLRRRRLALKSLDMFDMYVSIVPDYDVKVEWGEACEWVREACRPLGPEYMKGVDEAFSRRWIDVYENQGKRSGAYSGGCYGSPSYILMNYQNTLDHVFTLAHELGHSMHSRLANHSQPYRYADYPILIAEIASITNEALLMHYLIERKGDPRMKMALLNHFCDQVKGTVVRQAQFAEFERMIHEMDARGEPLTAESISEAYYALNAKYYGPAVKADRRIAHEWARIPHFYYNFYVYKYATGFCAAQIFARQILEGARGRDAYLDLLKAGGSDDPLDLIRRAGADLSRPETLANSFGIFRESIQSLAKLLA